MIIKVGTFSSHVDFTNNYLNVLEIEDKRLYANIVTSFYNAINDDPTKEKLILLINDELSSISNSLFMIMDVYSFDFNIRKINNKLINLLEKNIINDDILRLTIENKIYEIVNLIPEVTSILSLDLIWDNEIKIQKILNLFSIRFDQNYDDNYFQRTLKIVDIVKELEICDILVLCNLKSFLDDEELKELYKYIRFKEQNTLILESIVDNRLIYHERKIIVDYYFNDYRCCRFRL